VVSLKKSGVVFVGSKRPVSRSWKYLTTIFAAASSAARSGDAEAVEVVGEETDVVGDVVVLGDVVEKVGLGSFAVQADAAVIAARASVAAIRLLVVVISGTPRELTWP